ncbi:hypothetical protein JNB63_04425 [Microbacterium trichothecenolyticum]|uniref:hypothetical protein n=1 Tax=Microbacterium trichothecenolyticum TaxID=69370 RepID=UPI001C6F0222|nr:hypothetical protein [Microbacterium trichothecenolyticum]MBW9119330.1 hypothetical protein [Microbacterium trichothecenolyticum]
MRSVALACVLVLASAFLAGCAVLGEKPAPVTSATSPSGEVVTTDWSDFPAHAGVDGEPLLEYPDQAELPDRAREIIAGISRAIESESGLTLTPLQPEAEWFDDTRWHAQSGNGYGGQSMLTTVNCCELQSESAPDPRTWHAVLGAASDAAIEVGLDGFVLDEHTSDCNGDEDCWLWSATATDGVQWVYLTIQDGSRDPGGEAARDAKEFGWPLASIAIGYGATVIESGRREEYVEAMQPFIGQNRPPATTSD